MSNFFEIIQHSRRASLVLDLVGKNSRACGHIVSVPNDSVRANSNESNAVVFRHNLQNVHADTFPQTRLIQQKPVAFYFCKARDYIHEIGFKSNAFKTS